MTVTQADVRSEFGEIPDHAVASIEALDPTHAELAEARSRLEGDEMADRTEPSPRVRQIVRILSLVLADDEDDVEG